MAKTITRRYLQEQLADTETYNAQIKAAASMVGFDMDGETDTYLEKADQRIRMNIHQRGRINTLKSLLEDLDD